MQWYNLRSLSSVCPPQLVCLPACPLLPACLPARSHACLPGWFGCRSPLVAQVTAAAPPVRFFAGLQTLRPAVQFLAGEMRVDEGTVLPILATHNTVRMRFDMEQADYLFLAKADAAFPQNQFCMLADTKRNEVCGTMGAPRGSAALNLEDRGERRSTLVR
jgi:hypothetical protein